MLSARTIQLVEDASLVLPSSSSSHSQLAASARADLTSASLTHEALEAAISARTNATRQLLSRLESLVVNSQSSPGAEELQRRCQDLVVQVSTNIIVFEARVRGSLFRSAQEVARVHEIATNRVGRLDITAREVSTVFDSNGEAAGSLQVNDSCEDVARAFYDRSARRLASS